MSPRWATAAAPATAAAISAEGEGEGKDEPEGKEGKGGGGSGLDLLPEGAVVGTSSIRRTAMIRRRWPHLRVRDLRGNVGTRLRKLDSPSSSSTSAEYDAIVIAAAGLQRLGLAHRIAGFLDGREWVLGAVGQGALGVEWRAGDGWVEGVLEGVVGGGGGRGRRVGWECGAEREMLRVLEGGCAVPLGVECCWETEEEGVGGGKVGKEAEMTAEEKEYGGVLVMRAMVVSVDGKRCVEGTRRQWVGDDDQAVECGAGMAQELVEKGAGEILKEIDEGRARGVVEGVQVGAVA